MRITWLTPLAASCAKRTPKRGPLFLCSRWVSGRMSERLHASGLRQAHGLEYTADQSNVLLQIAPVAAQALQALADRLMRVCENPQQPGFNHFLFESVAALIRYGSEADPAMVVSFESSLFPAFEKVLQVPTQRPESQLHFVCLNSIWKLAAISTNGWYHSMNLRGSLDIRAFSPWLYMRQPDSTICRRSVKSGRDA